MEVIEVMEEWRKSQVHGRNLPQSSVSPLCSQLLEKYFLLNSSRQASLGFLSLGETWATPPAEWAGQGALDAHVMPCHEECDPRFLDKETEAGSG